MSINNVGSGFSASSAYSASSCTHEVGTGSTGSAIASLGDSISIGAFDSGESNPELEGLKSQRSQVQSEKYELQGQASNVRMQMVTRKDEIIQDQPDGGPAGEARAEYEEAKVEYEDFSASAEQSKQEYEQLSQETQAVQQEHTAKSQEQQQVAGELSSAQNELASLTPPAQPEGDDEQAQAAYQEQLNAYNAKKSELESKISALQQQQQLLQAECEKLLRDLYLKSQQASIAQKEHMAYTMSAQQAVRKMDELQQSMAEADPALQNAEQEDGELQSLQEEYDGLQQQIEAKDEELSRLDEQIFAIEGAGSLTQSERAARWAEDDSRSDEEKLLEAMEAEGFDVDEEEGVIHIGGTDGDDDIDITMGADGSYRVIVNGEETVYSAEEVKRLMIDGGEGDDNIRVHYDEETASFVDSPEQTGGEGDDVNTSSTMSDAYQRMLDSNFGDDEPKQPAIFINGGDGSDVIEADENVNTQLFITGGDGDDQITGGAADDVVIDSRGNNTIEGGFGNDIMIAGDGNDTVTDRDGENVIYTKGGEDNISLYDDSRYSDAEPDYFNYSRRVSEVHSGSGDDIITVCDGDNTIDGADGDDRIVVYKGSNTVSGGDGDDNITVHGGNNNVNAGDGGDKVKVYNGSNTVAGGEGDDEITVYDGVNIVHGQSGNDRIKAYHGDQVLCGEDGDDIIEGGDGRDYIEGGDGNDTIDGGEGGDVIYGGSGDDTIEGGSGNDYINGGAGSDKIHGNSGNDILFGLSGDDEIYGDEGEDTIAGGDGTDTVDGGEGADTIRYTDSDEHGHDTVLNADPSDDAKVLEPIEIPYNFKIETFTEVSNPYVGGVMGVYPMEEEAARAFEGIMRDNLEAFAAIDPGQEMLTAIAETGQTVIIRHMAEPNGYCRTKNSDSEMQINVNEDGSREASFGSRNGSVIGINPYFIDFGTGSPEYADAQFAEQNTMLVMAHELCHAYNNATGTIDHTYYNNDTGEWYNEEMNDRYVAGAELQAVGLHEDKLPYANPYGLTENDFRDYFHMVRRDSYLAPEEK